MGRTAEPARRFGALSMRVTVLGLAAALGAGIAAPPASGAQAPEAGPAAPEVGANEMPVSLDRIRRRLAAAEEAQEGRRTLLDLNFYVDVYARAPAIELLRDLDPQSESVPYGAPTHLEMLEAATPREWRPRAISTGNLFGWR